MRWRLLDKGCSLERGVQYKPKRVRTEAGVDNSCLYEWRRLLEHKLLSMLSSDVSISGSIFFDT